MLSFFFFLSFFLLSELVFFFLSSRKCVEPGPISSVWRTVFMCCVQGAVDRAGGLGLSGLGYETPPNPWTRRWSLSLATQKLNSLRSGHWTSGDQSKPRAAASRLPAEQEHTSSREELSLPPSTRYHRSLQITRDIVKLVLESQTNQEVED